MRKLMACVLLLLSLATTASAWEEPCVSTPDFTYEDETRSISIQKTVIDQSVCFIADVQIRDAEELHAGLAQSDFEALSVMAQREGAVLAINADDYRTHKYGVIIRNGQTLRVHNTTRHLLAILPDGSFETVSDRSKEKADTLAKHLEDEQVQDTFEFGPVLVENGEVADFPSAFDVISTRSTRREPRTAIGMIAPKHYVILVVDGRQPGYSEGVSLQTLQQIFVDLGVQTAINLDGGGSTELWFQGQILNQPAGGKERSVSDCIWF